MSRGWLRRLQTISSHLGHQNSVANCNTLIGHECKIRRVAEAHHSPHCTCYVLLSAQHRHGAPRMKKHAGSSRPATPSFRKEQECMAIALPIGQSLHPLEGNVFWCTRECRVDAHYEFKVNERSRRNRASHVRAQRKRINAHITIE